MVFHKYGRYFKFLLCLKLLLFFQSHISISEYLPEIKLKLTGNDKSSYIIRNITIEVRQSWSHFRKVLLPVKLQLCSSLRNVNAMDRSKIENHPIRHAILAWSNILN